MELANLKVQHNPIGVIQKLIVSGCVLNLPSVIGHLVKLKNNEKINMLNIEAVNHIGVRVSDKSRSVTFYESLGFQLLSDHGFERGHPVVMRHSSGVVLNLLGPATANVGTNVLMDVPEVYSGYTHIALTVDSLAVAKEFLQKNKIKLTGSFSFQGMSAVFFRDPDRNIIELDAYDEVKPDNQDDYSGNL